MVISSNQYPHFRIHYKNSKTKSQFISSYVDTTNTSHNNMNIEFTIEVYTSLYYYKSASKYNRIPCFVEEISKTTSKFFIVSKIKYVIFY